MPRPSQWLAAGAAAVLTNNAQPYAGGPNEEEPRDGGFQQRMLTINVDRH